MVTRGDFKEHLNQIEKQTIYIYDLFSILKRIFFWGGGG